MINWACSIRETRLRVASNKNAWLTGRFVPTCGQLVVWGLCPKMKNHRLRRWIFIQHLQWNSNPCCSLERAMSWAARRWRLNSALLYHGNSDFHENWVFLPFFVSVSQTEPSPLTHPRGKPALFYNFLGTYHKKSSLSTDNVAGFLFRNLMLHSMWS